MIQQDPRCPIRARGIEPTKKAIAIPVMRPRGDRQESVNNAHCFHPLTPRRSGRPLETANANASA